MAPHLRLPSRIRKYQSPDCEVSTDTRRYFVLCTEQVSTKPLLTRDVKSNFTLVLKWLLSWSLREKKSRTFSLFKNKTRGGSQLVLLGHLRPLVDRMEMAWGGENGVCEQ